MISRFAPRSSPMLRKGEDRRLATARLALGALLAVALGFPAHAQDPTVAAQVRDRALTDPTAWTILESLTTEIGARPTGSPAMERAKDWGLAKFQEYGFSNIRTEPFMVEAWRRGPESAEVVAPFPQPLTILGLGRSVPTPPGGIEAEVVVFARYADLIAAAPGSLAGKIAVVNEPMVRARDGSGYGALGPNRRTGASEAARRGAVAYLTRSLSTDDTDLPHTGAMNYQADAPRIPAAALSTPDADLLARMASRGPTRVRLSLASETFPATAWNISGDLPGTSDEIVVVGGHLDSWDVGTGAHDDGAGVAMTFAAAKLAADAPGDLRRTIRVVMWGAEEMGDSSDAYLAAHRAELSRIVLASESDNGAGGAYALRLPAAAYGTPAFAAAAGLFGAIGVQIETQPAAGAGADVAGLIANGVPAFAFRTDASRYFDLHHSSDDTLDKVEPARLNQMTAAWALMLYLAASSDQDFRPRP